MRRMVRETTLAADDLVMPLFVVPGSGETRPVPSMPGVWRLSTDVLGERCREILAERIPAVLLFGVPDAKDACGDCACDPDGLVPNAVRAIKSAAPELVVITDVCLCAYTDHGHCGVVNDGRIDNDATLEQLASMASCHARAGADVVAPSDMMDGRVGAIRARLDDEGFAATAILSYSAKYASSFYGPFRDAAESAPSFGDRRTHQMDPANAREAVREIALDVAEGADIVMVKPALAYLDVIRAAREAVDVPIAAYNVSGEYAMVKAAAANGWIDERSVVLETLTAIRRAGADIVITYHALDVARWLAS
jgi:porphobilinogen synthase